MIVTIGIARPGDVFGERMMASATQNLHRSPAEASPYMDSIHRLLMLTYVRYMN
jgi:hypothetical protein